MKPYTATVWFAVGVIATLHVLVSIGNIIANVSSVFWYLNLLGSAFVAVVTLDTAERGGVK
jgi:hypothetical protein